MTIAEYNAKMEADIAKIDEKLDKAIRLAALSALAEMSQRIFEQGKASDGSKIGNYTQTFVTTKTSPYINRRKKKGLAVDKVTLEFSSDLKKDFENSITKIDGGYAAGTKKEENSNKVKWNEELFQKKVFQMTKEEEDRYLEMVDKLMLKEQL